MDQKTPISFIMNNHLEIIPVFETGRLGCREVRIPAIVQTAKGTLLAFCETRHGLSDWARIDIIQRRSTDGGLTWGDVKLLAQSTGGPVSNPTPIAAADGKVHFLFQRDYARCYYMVSGDDGISWSAPSEITQAFEAFRPEYAWKVLAPGPGHAVELKRGRLVVPVWLCAPSAKEGGDHRPSCVATVYSDDSGTTWRRGDIVVDTTPETPNPSETSIAELSDGRVMLNIRSESSRHRRILIISPDGVSGWSAPAFAEDLYEPVCMAGFLNTTDPRTGNHVLLFSNPDSRHHPEEIVPEIHFCTRENGVIKASFDNGETWSSSRVIDAGPFSYSDLAASTAGMIYCLYESGIWGKRPHHSNTHIALARFSLRWIENDPAKAVC